MPDENTVLTALGLDTSQFESATTSAAGKVNAFIQAANSLDKELRKIPIVGDLYAISFGKIAEGFAQTREEGREFARIMRTDVNGSLEGTEQKLDDINNSLAKLKTGSFSRSISDFATNATRVLRIDKASNVVGDAFKLTRDNLPLLESKVKNVFAPLRGKSSFVDGILDGFGKAERAAKSFFSVTSAQKERESQITEEQKERQRLLESLVSLYEKSATANSAAYSQSQLATEQAKIDLDISNKKEEAQRKIGALAGPDRAKWDAKYEEALRVELGLLDKVADKEKQASQTRFNQANLQNISSVASSYFEAAGNARDIANQQVSAANENLQLLKDSTQEQKNAAQAALDIARNHQAEVEIEYELSKRQLDLETELMSLEVSGQTRAANQTKIQAQYETRIADELRRENVERANALKSQMESAKLAEAVRLYELGAGGRARERQEERRKAQEVRIVQNQQRNRDADDKQKNQTGVNGLSSGGLRSGGLSTGDLYTHRNLVGSLLDKKTKPQSEDQKREATQNKLFDILAKIQGNLGG